MDEKKCKKCGVPLEEGDECSCNEELCRACCECEPGCDCGCHGDEEV